MANDLGSKGIKATLRGSLKSSFGGAYIFAFALCGGAFICLTLPMEQMHDWMGTSRHECSSGGVN